jgi:uncharacterized membrane protein
MSFWLSHHPKEEYHRTVSLLGARVCARCLGTYPTLFFALAAQFLVRAPLEWKGDGWVTLGLFVPAVLDWAVGRFRPRLGSNAWRLVTGFALGVALGRSLYIHLQRPFPLWLVLQAAGVTAVAVPVILVAYRKGSAR